MIGKELVIKQYQDKAIIAKRPDMSNRVLSEKQIECNMFLKAANTYAKNQYYDPELKKAAQERLQIAAGKSLFYALVREGMNELRTKQKEQDGQPVTPS